MHLDPARTMANFAAIVSHTEEWNEPQGLEHMIIDRIYVWRPRDFPNSEIDSLLVLDQLLAITKDLRVQRITVDQYDAPLITQLLNQRVIDLRLSWNVSIEQIPATAARNSRQAKLFQEAIALNLVHSYPHDQLRDELLHLQEHRPGQVGPPTGGAVTTADTADCAFALVEQLLGDQLDRHRALAHFTPTGLLPGGITPNAHDQAIFDQLSELGCSRGAQGYDPARGSRFRGRW
jgi:hypothetical protein